MNRRFSKVLEIDARALVAFRVALGLIVVVDVVFRFLDLGAFYTDFGAVPRALVEAEHPPPLLFRAFFLSGDPVPTAMLLGVLGAAGVLLSSGRATRLATFVCWLLWCSLMARNPYVLNFGDRFLRVMLFWALFMPLGGRSQSDPTGSGALSFGAAAYQFQIAGIYFFSGLLKIDPMWMEGDALRVALLFDQLVRPFGRVLAGWPLLCEALTYATLGLEVVAALLVFSPLRTAAVRILLVASFVAFHLGIAATMRLGHFPFVCIVAWIPFLPAIFWDRFLGAELPGAGAKPRLSDPRWKQAAVVGLLLLVLLVNVDSLKPRNATWLPAGVNEIARQVGLDQRWSMFAPHPSRVDGWFVLSGRHADGLLVDLQRKEGAPRWTKPADVGAQYPNHRWMGYMVKLHTNRERSAQKEAYAAYLCREWNLDPPSDQRIDHVSIDFVQELTHIDGTEDPPIRLMVLRTECDAQEPLLLTD